MLSITSSGLREEFEMDSRLRKIESKLSMLQQNTNFFIEMLHNQKRSVPSTKRWIVAPLPHCAS